MLMTDRLDAGTQFPLHLAEENEKVRLMDVGGGKHLLRQLLAMGLLDGSELQVLRNRPQQDLLVSHHQSRWIISSGMAREMLVAHVG